MKVRLIIGKFSTYGGAEAVAFRFARFLQSQGLLKEVVCGRNEIEEFPGKVVSLGMLKPGRFLKTFSFNLRVNRYLSLVDNQNVVNFSFAKVENVDVYRNGGGTHLGFLKESIKAYSGFEGLRKRITRFLNPVNHFNPRLEGGIFSSVKKIIAVSEKVKEEIVRFYGKKLEKKIEIIPNGIDVKRFSPEIKGELRKEERKRLKYGKNDFVLGFASSNFKLKGLPILIEVLSDLPDNFKLLVAGGRNSKKYKALAERKGVIQRVKFLGKVREMERFYAAIDCLVHPSFYDTFGNVVAEALSMEVPVVVSNNTGAKDLVVNGKVGYVVNVDRSEILKAILRVFELNPDFSCVKLMSDEEVFRRYVSLAESVLEGRVEKT